MAEYKHRHAQSRAEQSYRKAKGMQEKRSQSCRSSTLPDRLAVGMALSGKERTEIVRWFLGREMSSVLVQIQVDAYMFTLRLISFCDRVTG